MGSVFIDPVSIYATSKNHDKERKAVQELCSSATVSPIDVQMLWIFERKGEQMRCEIRREGAGPGYEMIVTAPDGSQRMERFDETNDLIKRTLDLQRELLETGWRQPKT